ncbi:MAG TPA: MFS transporter [Ktedonobacteraceae bacterium]|nr:MFS transporter [Ktedonobacteraceae bacterium]
MSYQTDTSPFETTATPAVPLWRNRDYLLLWSGQAVSSIGSNASGLAIPLLILALTNSPIQAGIVGALRVLATLLIGLPAGALIDRWDRRWTMILCDAGRAVVLASLPLALWGGWLTLLQLYLVSLIEGVLFVFFDLAQVACLPRVVAKEQLSAATAQNEVTDGIVTLLGPSLGGLLYGINWLLPFLTDALSYTASLLSLFLIRTPLQQQHMVMRRALLAEIGEGFAWLRRQAMLRTIAWLTSGLIFSYSGMSLIIIVVAQQQHASSFVIGVIFALGGIGSIVGSLLGTPLERRWGFGRTTKVVFWLFALLWPLYALSPAPLLLGAILAGFWLLDGIYDVLQISYRLARIPDHLQGRVGSASRLLINGTYALGQALSGLLLQQVGVFWTIGLFALCFVGLALAVTLSPHLRQAAHSRS